jgi:putative ABC transport system permease protein
MIVFTMLRARWIQALTMFAFSAGATVATIAGPAYLDRVHQRIVAHSFADATLPQRLLTLDGGEGDNQSGPDALDVMKVLLPTTGFTWISAREFTGIDTAGNFTDRTVDRQDICAHVTIVSGRCLVGIGEILVPESLATSLGVHAGQTMPLTFKTVTLYDSVGDPVGGYDGTPPVSAVTVVGIYRPIDTRQPYWGSGNYFPVGGKPPLLINDSTLAAMSPAAVGVSIDALAGKSAFADTTRLSAQLNKLATQLSTLNGSVSMHSAIPEVIGAIRTNRVDADQVVPIAAVPVVVLAWFVVFVASAYGAAGRRQEFANIALRGAPAATRWRLALGEGAVAVIAGTFVAWVGTAIWTPVPYYWPLIALAGCLMAVAAAAVKPLRTSVAVLLRSAGGSRVASRLGVTGEVLIVILAAAAYVLMRSQHGRLTGISLTVPWMIILGVSVVASILVAPVARRIGALAMSRGRVATALAAYQVGRRPGARRLLILLTISVAVLAYSLAGIDVARQDRQDVSTITTGASSVLDVKAATRDQLLSGVRAADPRGTWAMAVVAAPQATGNTHPMLAVDATRFGAVVAWMPGYSTSSAARIGALLHPADVPVPLPVVSTENLGTDATVRGLDAHPLRVTGVAVASALPRLGRTGTIVDLEYADLSTSDNGAATDPQVWLGPHAPANAVALLAAHGILTIDETRLADARDALDGQGAVLALWYHVFAALLALILTIGTLILVAATDRPPRGAELWALRVQGMSVRTVARAARGGYAVITLVAAVGGLAAGALAWKLTASALPIYASTDLWPAPHWPATGPVLVPWGIASTVLLVIALGIGADLRRSVSRR